MNGPADSLNGWSLEERERLARKTRAPVEQVETFCGAVDKQLFLMLGERQRRATLRFHLRAESDDYRVDVSGLPPSGPRRIE